MSCQSGQVSQDRSVRIGQPELGQIGLDRTVGTRQQRQISLDRPAGISQPEWSALTVGMGAIPTSRVFDERYSMRAVRYKINTEVVKFYVSI
jgi:hypothetical protein